MRPVARRATGLSLQVRPSLQAYTLRAFRPIPGRVSTILDVYFSFIISYAA
jgi:hypothetical protein